MTSLATTWALRQLEASRTGPLEGIHARHALLALAVLCDQDLNTSGLSQVRPDRVARTVGLALSTVNRTLRALSVSGYAVLVVEWAGMREYRSGTAAIQPLRGGPRLLGYRIPESAFNAEAP